MFLHYENENDYAIDNALLPRYSGYNVHTLEHCLNGDV